MPIAHHIITCPPPQIFRPPYGHVALVYGSFDKYGKSSEKSLQMSQLCNSCKEKWILYLVELLKEKILCKEKLSEYRIHKVTSFLIFAVPILTFINLGTG